MIAPQAEPIVAISSRFAGQIVTILELVLAFIGGLLAVGTIRLVARGLRRRDENDSEVERIITLHDRK